MMSRTPKVRRNTNALAAFGAIAALSATIFAPAGFGRSISSAAFWDDIPVIIEVPAVVSPGQDIPCTVTFEAQPETANAKNVTVYSDPPGAVSYSGTVTGSSAVIPAHVSANAAPGIVTIFIQTDNSSPSTATTTVTGG